MNRELISAVRRFADSNSNRIAAAADTGGRVIVTVTVVSPLTVSWRGADVVATGQSRDHTFAVGDRVVCDLIDNQLIVAYPLA